MGRPVDLLCVRPLHTTTTKLTMRHDYDLPPDWDALSDTEKSKWMTRERCRRQAKQQGSPALKHMESLEDRRERILSARGHVSVKEKR